MIEFRWAVPGGTFVPGSEYPKLQYRTLFYPVLIASGDIVLAQKTKDELEWVDVPTLVMHNEKVQASGAPNNNQEEAESTASPATRG
ncbi:MAG: hypothetical protein ACYC36_03715 [Bellilinea sp.]